MNTTNMAGERVTLIKIIGGWVVVVDYGQQPGIGRHGYWCEDAAGGWGVSSRSAADAIEQCKSPRTYQTRQAALEAIGADEPFLCRHCWKPLRQDRSGDWIDAETHTTCLSGHRHEAMRTD